MDGLRTALGRAPSACSCSYTVPLHPSPRSRTGASSRTTSKQTPYAPGWSSTKDSRNHNYSLSVTVQASKSSSGSGGSGAANVPTEQPAISGYTPANYIVYSEDPEHTCSYDMTVSVGAPVAVCWELWHDWSRLVEFFDMVAQIGLNPDEPESALFQCFYRWQFLPTMELVFVLTRTEVVEKEKIAFESVWGMPLDGSVSFKSNKKGGTDVTLSFSHSLPLVLTDLNVKPAAIQQHMHGILSENLAAFVALAESGQPSSLPSPLEGDPLYPVTMESPDLPDEEEQAAWEELMAMEPIGWEGLQLLGTQLQPQGGEDALSGSPEQEQQLPAMQPQVAAQEPEQPAVVSSPVAPIAAPATRKRTTSRLTSEPVAAGKGASAGPQAATKQKPAAKKL